MLQFLKKHALLASAFGLAVALTLFFLGAFTVSSLRWSHPDRFEQPIAGWMTPRYVARSWNVAPSVVADALGLVADGTGRRMTLQDVADAQGRDLEDIRQTLTAAIVSARDGSDD